MKSLAWVSVILLALAVQEVNAATVVLEVTSPKGGELYIVGQAQRIRTATKFKTVNLELSRDGGATFTPLGVINNAVKDKTLQNQFIFSVTGPTAPNCVIRARGVTTKGEVVVQSGSFAIVAGATLGLVIATDIADGSITTPKLAAKAVTDIKIGSGPASTGMVLQADGIGGAAFGSLTGNGSLLTNIASSALPIAGTTPATRGVVYVDQTSIEVKPDGRISAIGQLPPTNAGGDLSGTYPNPAVASVGGYAAPLITASVLSTQNATNLANPNTLVKRDAAGNFAANTITANLNGVASSATTAGTATNAAALNGKPDTAFAAAAHTHFGEHWVGSAPLEGLYVGNTEPSKFCFGIVGDCASTQGAGVYGFMGSPTGNTAGVSGISSSTNGIGVSGIATSTTGPTRGVLGVSSSSVGTGVIGRNNATSGVDAIGVQGETTSVDAAGVLGTAVAVSGSTTGVTGIASSPDGAGVFGLGSATTGDAIGVQGESRSPIGTGVFGLATSTTGINSGVTGLTNSPNGYAGYFFGRVHVNGTLSKQAGSFRIDHPLDPTTKYLSHSFVESPDMKNIYDGVAVFDAKGEATISLPSYFEALNRDFRYQLTCIGAHAAVYVSEEIKSNTFRIAGGAPGLKVSWQVTGSRQDAYAKAHPIVVEQVKSEAERGQYLSPVEHGQSQAKALFRRQ